MLKQLVKKKGDKAAEEVGIKNHLTTLLNIAMQASKENIAEYVEALSKDMTSELKGFYEDFEKVSRITIDMANHCSEHISKPILASDIMQELKSLSDAVSSLALPSPVPPLRDQPSLMDELADLGAPHNRKVAVATVDVAVQSSLNESTEGWRTLGTKKVWRADWTEYDLRKRIRELQDKLKEKANKRKKALKRRYNNNNNNNSNKLQNKRDSRSTHPAKLNNDSNRHNSNSSSSLWSKNHPRADTGYQDINNASSSSKSTQHATGSSLPLDKDLLAAAKQQFSRPPIESHRGIRFQRGETLNPYPADQQSPHSSSTSASPNWTFGPALRSSFSNHCVPCSCQQVGF